VNSKDRYKYIIGVDEVGRGPLAGPVTVCACMVTKKHHDYIKKECKDIDDSKKLSEQKRNHFNRLAHQLKKEGTLFFACSSVSAPVIDARGITYAIRLALSRSLAKLSHEREHTKVFLDGGLKAPHTYIHQETIIGGDGTQWLISLASVIAKCYRDKAMVRYSKQYPEYGFDQHKGYGTQQHRNALKKYGVCPLHRKTWVA
jgi:ribonuclease HII